jgi:hypothetical protein
MRDHQAETGALGLLATLLLGAVFPAARACLVGAWALITGRNRRVRAGNWGFPFVRLGSADELADVLRERRRLTVTTNAFVSRVGGAVEGVGQVGQRWALIIGPGGRGKTREALEVVRSVVDGGPWEILVPSPELGCVPDPPPAPQWPQLGPNVVLFWDELDLAFGETAQMRRASHEGKLPLPPEAERWRDLLDALRARVPRLVVIATAREERLGRLAGLDEGHLTGAWAAFQLVRLAPLAADEERRLIRGLAAEFELTVPAEVEDYLVEQSRGVQAESVALFMRAQGRGGPRTVSLGNAQAFRQSASDYWTRQTYEPLVATNGYVAPLLRAARYLGVDLGLPLDEWAVVEVATEAVPGAMPDGLLAGAPALLGGLAMRPLRRRRARRALAMLCQGGFVGREGTTLWIADYQLEGRPKLAEHVALLSLWWLTLGRLSLSAATKVYRHGWGPLLSPRGAMRAAVAADEDPRWLIVHLLALPHSEMGRAAAERLRELGESAVGPLIAMLEGENRWIRGRAASALGQVGDAGAVEVLIGALDDEYANVRWRAAGALGDIGDLRAVGPLIAALEDTDKRPASSAAEALGRIGDARAADRLRALCSHRHRRVRRRALQAADHIEARLREDRAGGPAEADAEGPSQ